ncbi:MAG TPA: hypothetical protein VET83_01175 [Candidatus Dormibacteraeota bacterium]|nr:hypothetical protein [Candidatus Dormibacteraeota bacterium]
MIAGIGWQDLVALSATLGAGAWLFRRWLLKRRAKAGCDTCAASMHARMARTPEGSSARPLPPKSRPV